MCRHEAFLSPKSQGSQHAPVARLTWVGSPRAVRWNDKLMAIHRIVNRAGRPEDHEWSIRAAAPGRERPPMNLVENTGIEPVTSWLQTRRSPS